MYSIGKNLAVQSTADGLFAGPDANPGSAACRLVLRASLRHMPVPTRRIARAGRTRPSAGAGSILRQASGSRPRHDHHPRLQRLFSSRLAPSAEGGVDAGASQCRFLSLLTRKLAGDCSAYHNNNNTESVCVPLQVMLLSTQSDTTSVCFRPSIDVVIPPLPPDAAFVKNVLVGRQKERRRDMFARWPGLQMRY